MEMFVRYLIIALAPIIQLILVVKRVQLKIKINLGFIFVLSLVLDVLFSIIAASVFPSSLSPCIGCQMDHGTHGAFVFIFGTLLNWLLNIVFTIIGLILYSSRQVNNPN